MEPIELGPEDRELEESLSMLRPSTVAIAVEQFYYRAGVVVGRRQMIVWRGVAATLMLVCAVMFSYRSRPAPIELPHVAAVLHDEITTADQNSLISGDASYLSLRSAVLEKGIDALPIETRNTIEHRDLPIWLDLQSMENGGRS